MHGFGSVLATSGQYADERDKVGLHTDVLLGLLPHQTLVLALLELEDRVDLAHLQGGKQRT